MNAQATNMALELRYTSDNSVDGVVGFINDMLYEASDYPNWLCVNVGRSAFYQHYYQSVSLEHVMWQARMKREYPHLHWLYNQ